MARLHELGREPVRMAQEAPYRRQVLASRRAVTAASAMRSGRSTPPERDVRQDVSLARVVPPEAIAKEHAADAARAIDR